ncbi:putative trans-sialidase, partial [Trypanosoma cruzi]
MLSRAAAVKAPRTHNRRRVTGSSGRRREGGESERQRPNMSRHLFYSAVLLLVLVMMCCNAGGAAEAAGQSPEPQFGWKDIKDEVGVTVESLGAPGLLKVGSDVFAVAEAQCKKDENTFTGIASQILTKDNTNTPVEIMNDAKKDAQVLEEGTTPNKKKVDVSRPTTVVKGKDIYMLVGKNSRTDAADAQERGAGDWGLLLVKGKVNSVEENNKKIDWKDTTDVPQASVDELDSWTGLTGGGGSGLKMDDGRLLFPVEGTKKEKKGESNDGKTVSLLIYSSEDTAESWKLSKEIPDGGCSDPSVVEWKKKDKKLMMMTACDDGRRRVYESGDKGESWTEALGTLSRVWGSNKKGKAKAVRSGFITATIDGVEDNRNVMLVTLPVYPEKAVTGGTSKGKLHLWLTDNTHIVDIGPVSDDDAAASSLLYKSAGSGDNEKDELIALYEKDGEKPSHSLWSVRLTAQLQRVKDVLATWKKVDDRVSELCPSKSAAESASPENARSTAVRITDGLVGFLSGNFSEYTWRDEYLGVNATVKNNDEGNKATLHAGGVTFKGAWAEWPVGRQGENQPYHFANYNFTLVATVSIDGEPQEGPIPLMGVQMNDSGKTVLLGLSYNKEKKWQVLCSGGKTTEHSSTWEKDTTHQVVLVLRNGTQGSAYVDGQRVGEDEACALENKDSKAVSHFYIGGDGNSAGGAGNQADVSVTVTNVLLYNRPLDDTEIAALNPNKAPTPSPVKEPSQGTVIKISPGGQGKEGQRQLLGSSDVKGVSASTVSSARNSSGEEGPATPLASEESFDGSKNVGGASSPGSDAAVEVAGGTNGQGEDIHARDKEAKAAALSSSLGNVSQGNNSDAGTVRGSGLLPSLLLLLGLWGFA